MFILIALFLLTGNSRSQVADSTSVPELLVIVGQDTMSSLSQPDSLNRTAFVGDTLSVEFHARNWPEVTGYAIDISTLDRAKEGSTYTLGDYLKVSGPPVTVAGLVIHGSVFQVGQASFGGSQGHGSGHLITLDLVFDKSGAEELQFDLLKYTILTDSQTGASEQVEINLGLRLFVAVDPLEIQVTSDLDKSGTVDFDDFLIFVSAFSTRRGGLGFNELSDFNGDDSIDFIDFLAFAADFGGPPRTHRTIIRS